MNLSFSGRGPMSEFWDVRTEPSGGGKSPGAWLDDAWASLTDRSRDILTRRMAGETLDSIGLRYGCTREHIRQLQSKATKSLVAAQELSFANLGHILKEACDSGSPLQDSEVVDASGLEDSVAREVILRALGIHRVIVDAATAPPLWSLDRKCLQDKLHRLGAVVPCSEDEFEAAAADLALAGGLAWSVISSAQNLGIVKTEFGWVRLRKRARDTAFLWLRSEGSPRSMSELAATAGADNEHAFSELLRRDASFAQVRPEGTWALTDWKVPGTDKRYGNALDVVVEVLHDLGPLPVERLRVEARARYPVTVWRIDQCLSSNVVGLNSEGLFDLVERGAVPVEDTEPRMPKNIQVQGSVVGYSRTVDRDVLRGSGLPVNKWLTWYLDLRTAPATRYFRLPGAFGDLTVRRATSNAQLSSLRAVSVAMGLVDGCQIVLLLKTDTDTADVVHRCPQGDCPAGGTASHRLSEL